MKKIIKKNKNIEKNNPFQPPQTRRRSASRGGKAHDDDSDEHKKIIKKKTNHDYYSFFYASSSSSSSFSFEEKNKSEKNKIEKNKSEKNKIEKNKIEKNKFKKSNSVPLSGNGMRLGEQKKSQTDRRRVGGCVGQRRGLSGAENHFSSSSSPFFNFNSNSSPPPFFNFNSSSSSSPFLNFNSNSNSNSSFLFLLSNNSPFHRLTSRCGSDRAAALTPFQRARSLDGFQRSKTGMSSFFRSHQQLHSNQNNNQIHNYNQNQNKNKNNNFQHPLQRRSASTTSHLNTTAVFSSSPCQKLYNKNNQKSLTSEKNAPNAQRHVVTAKITSRPAAAAAVRPKIFANALPIVSAVSEVKTQNFQRSSSPVEVQRYRRSSQGRTSLCVATTSSAKNDNNNNKNNSDNENENENGGEKDRSDGNGIGEVRCEEEKEEEVEKNKENKTNKSGLEEVVCAGSVFDSPHPLSSVDNEGKKRNFDGKCEAEDGDRHTEKKNSEVKKETQNRSDETSPAPFLNNPVVVRLPPTPDERRRLVYSESPSRPDVHIKKFSSVRKNREQHLSLVKNKQKEKQLDHTTSPPPQKSSLSPKKCLFDECRSVSKQQRRKRNVVESDKHVDERRRRQREAQQLAEDEAFVWNRSDSDAFSASMNSTIDRFTDEANIDNLNIYNNEEEEEEKKNENDEDDEEKLIKAHLQHYAASPVDRLRNIREAAAAKAAAQKEKQIEKRRSREPDSGRNITADDDKHKYHHNNNNNNNNNNEQIDGEGSRTVDLTLRKHHNASFSSSSFSSSSSPDPLTPFREVAAVMQTTTLQTVAFSTATR